MVIAYSPLNFTITLCIKFNLLSSNYKNIILIIIIISKSKIISFTFFSEKSGMLPIINPNKNTNLKKYVYSLKK